EQHSSGADLPLRGRGRRPALPRVAPPALEPLPAESRDSRAPPAWQLRADTEGRAAAHDLLHLPAAGGARLGESRRAPQPISDGPHRTCGARPLHACAAQHQPVGARNEAGAPRRALGYRRHRLRTRLSSRCASPRSAPRLAIAPLSARSLAADFPPFPAERTAGTGAGDTGIRDDRLAYLLHRARRRGADARRGGSAASDEWLLPALQDASRTSLSGRGLRNRAPMLENAVRKPGVELLEAGCGVVGVLA